MSLVGLWPMDSFAAAVEAVTEQRTLASAAGRDRVTVEVVTRSGRAAGVEFRVRLDTVEVFLGGVSCGALDRDTLRCWLAAPDKTLQVDEVELSADRFVDEDGRVAITVPGVDRWTLSPTELAALVRRV